MKRFFTQSMMMILMVIATINFSKAALTSDAGTASVSEDSICANGNSTLILTGYTGLIQWQSYDGSNWIDETGPGSTTDNYLVAPAATTDYRAVVTDPGFPSDTSNVVTITVGVTAPTTTGDTRCGYGPVTLTASGGSSIHKWDDVPTGGSPLYSGSSFTTNVSQTTTFYAAASSNGGGAGTTPMPPEDSPFAFNTRGYWFTSPIDFTIIGLYVPEPINGNTQNIAVLHFDNQIPPPAYPTVTNAFTTLYITQNNPAVGVIPVNIQIFAGDVIGILATRGLNTNSYAVGPYVTDIDGNAVSVMRMGMQFELSSVLPIDIWEEPGGSISRCEITYEVGCESGRTPAVATVTPADSISITAVPPALCQGQSSVISVSSNNPNYSYTWSPATGLSGTTGSSVTATPNSPITYTVIADDGTCGSIDSVFMSVGPASVAGTAVISTDTICLGTSAILTLTGYTGNIQWQSNNGSGWVNETGPGSTTDNYEVSPTASLTYQAIVTSGGCAPETTITINLAVLTIVDPITVNDTICGPGIANLSASGVGVLEWYAAPTGGNNLNTGPTYNPNVAGTTTYYVQASAGGHYLVGPPNLSFGSQISLAGNDYGLQFDVIQQCTIDRVSVSPGITTGNITVNLKDLGGVVLNTATIPVTAFSGLVPVNLGFTVNPGTYRLELATGSVPLYHNTTNAAYPYTSPGCPITIAGALNPVFQIGQYYYFFYNWEVNAGCASNRVPVTAVVNSLPPVPTISQNGSVLTSSAPSSNQWYLNGSPIPGATGTTHDMSTTGPGTYTVMVTDVNGCSSESLPIIYVGIREDLVAAGINVYPNPVKDVLAVEFNSISSDAMISIYNSLGELLLTQKVSDLKTEIGFRFPAGVYSVEIKTTEGNYVTNVVKL